MVDGATSAPTILNGPGLATAGNTDPDSESIVSGLVPGLKPLRDAGYNVVTWDPRGEFDSGGRLQLDSPAFEGKDVQAIISWVTDNRAYTYPAFDIDVSGDANEPAFPDDPNNPKDPAIGMVGGSYGGGIQLVTAGIDNRVDVIVPGIAWNSLNDSLYPRDAFKTSYSSLLLLALVHVGRPDQPADLRRDHHRRRVGHPHPGPAGIAGRQRPGLPDGEHRHPDAVHPGHRRCAVPAAAGVDQRGDARTGGGASG